MDFVDGQTLDVWLRDKSRRWQEVVEVFLAAGNGLAAAHTANVVHRDFKPQNVMIDRGERVHVKDFELARSLSECDPLNELGGRRGRVASCADFAAAVQALVSSATRTTPSSAGSHPWPRRRRRVTVHLAPKMT